MKTQLLGVSHNVFSVLSISDFGCGFAALCIL